MPGPLGAWRAGGEPVYAADLESKTLEILSPSLGLSFFGLTTLSSSDTGGLDAVWQTGQRGGLPSPVWLELSQNNQEGFPPMLLFLQPLQL